MKTSVQLSKKLVDEGTDEEIISTQKMMLDNATILLTKREEYFKAHIPSAKLSYTSPISTEPINALLLIGLTRSLGEVRAEKQDIKSNQNSSIQTSQLNDEVNDELENEVCILNDEVSDEISGGKVARDYFTSNSDEDLNTDLD